MSIKSASILFGATATLSGGTATPFVPSAQAVTNGVMVVASGDTNPATRRNMTFKTRAANLDPSTGKFSGKEKRQMVICEPEVLSDGSVSFDLVRIEIEAHPQSSAGKLAKLRGYAISVLADADIDNFVNLGSTD